MAGSPGQAMIAKAGGPLCCAFWWGEVKLNQHSPLWGESKLGQQPKIPYLIRLAHRGMDNRIWSFHHRRVDKRFRCYLEGMLTIASFSKHAKKL